MTTLDLVLKHKWYDMIAMGKKREEYHFVKFSKILNFLADCLA